MTNSTVEIIDKLEDCETFEKLSKQAVEDIKNRAGKSGQFLNWIERLPNIQLENLDNMAETVKPQKAISIPTLLYWV